MKKNVLSILLCLCMVISLLPTTALAADTPAQTVTVGEVELTSEAPYWKNGDNSDSGATGTTSDYNAYFDAATATLTLRNAVVTGAVKNSDNYGIYAVGNLTVALEGSSTVTGGEAANNSYGVYSRDSLTISGGGSLVATGGEATNACSYGVYGSGSVSITGDHTTVTATGGETTSGSSYGVAGVSGVKIKGSTVTAIGGKAASNSYGVSGENCTVEIEGSATVTAIGGAATNACSYGLSGGNAGNVSISGDHTKVTAVAGTAKYESYGVYGGNSGNITYTSGLLVAKGQNGPTKGTMSGEPAPVASSAIYAVYSSSNVYHVQVSNVTVDTPKVTGHIEWVGNNLTLTDTILIGADGADGAAALTIPSGGTLTLAGCNVVLAGNSTSGNSYGVKGAGNLTISDTSENPGSLLAIGGTVDATSIGVYGMGSVFINGTAAVTAIGGSGSYSYGGYGDSVFISGTAAVTAIGGTAVAHSYGMCSGGSVVIGESGSPTVTAIGGSGSHSYGVWGNSVSISGTAAVTAIGGAATGGEATAYSYGVCCNDSVSISGGSGAAIAGSGTTAQAISGDPSLGPNVISTGKYTDKVMTWAELPAHTHCVCGGSVAGHESHSDIPYTRLTITGSTLGEGNYYLDGDVTLTSSLVIDGVVNLCLNGHKLIGSGSGRVISVGANATLNVCDCQTTPHWGKWDGDSYTLTDSDPSDNAYTKFTGGVITGGKGNTGGGVYNGQGGTFNLYGGNIAGNSATNDGGGVSNYGTFTQFGGSIANNRAKFGGGMSSIETFNLYDGSITGNTAANTGGGVYSYSGTFTLYGGNITDNTATDNGGGVYNENCGTFTLYGGSIAGNSAKFGGGVYNWGTFNLSGAPTVFGNTKESGAVNNVQLPENKTIQITDALRETARIGVTMETPAVFTSGTAVTNKAYLANFSSDDTYERIAATADNQLKLQPAITAAETPNGTFTVKVNDSVVSSASAGDAVTITPIPASGYVLDTVTVTKMGDPGTVVPVSSNTFTMPDYPVTVTGTFKASGSTPGGSSGGSSGGAAISTNTALVVVNGKTENIGKIETTSTETKVTVDSAKLTEKISTAPAGSDVAVTVNNSKPAATVEIVLKNVEDMAQKDMTLSVQTGGVSYNLPTGAVDTAAVLKALGATDSTKVPVSVTIEKAEAVSVSGATVIGTPTSFTVTASFGGKTTEVVRFDQYVPRVIEVTAEQAAKLTTAIVKETNGGIRHVPTVVYTQNSKWFAKINSRTNSTYALISNPQSFADAEGKWYEAAVNEMAGRKILNGSADGAFNGETGVTRAGFAAIIVRALGLPADGKADFTDVNSADWCYGAVGTAVEYGIVSGYSDGSFKPNKNITRLEAMVMLQRAAKLTGWSGASGSLDGFTDSASVGAWAQDAARFSVGSGLIMGSNGKLAPNENISRAQTAVVVLRLLQKAGLVDVRTQA